MQVQKCSLKNFGSYPTLDIDFNNKGLILVHGCTGSGKSTLTDAPCWVIYGQTSKQGATDDIRSFNTKEPTVGVLTVSTNSGIIEITRIRGHTNDLYWIEEGSNEKLRGKDSTETQKLLNQRLGVDAETYVTASHYHELSPSATFFLDKAKARRELLEKLTDLEFPKNLELKLAERKKDTKQLILQSTVDLATSETTIREVKSNIIKLTQKAKEWENENNTNIQYFTQRSLEFKSTRDTRIRELEKTLQSFGPLDNGSTIRNTLSVLENRLSAISPITCSECGNQVEAEEKLELTVKISEAKAKLNYLTSQISRRDDVQKRLDSETRATNTYREQAEREKTKVNPFRSTISEYTKSLKAHIEADSKNHVALNALRRRLSDFEILSSTTTTLRAELLKLAVNAITEGTNSRLDRFFDSELRVYMEPGAGDTIEIDIQKSGNSCNFKQLSKGQRQLLRLCFSLAVMQVASNQAGQDFELIILDEPTDGVDSDLKIKSYALYEDLAICHKSVMVIEHNSEIKSMFNNSIEVTIAGDESSIRES